VVNIIDKQNLNRLAGWVGFFGIVTLIIGIMQAVTIIGIIPGVIYIVLAVKLLGVKSSAKAIAATSGDTPDQLNKMVNDLRVYFQINGILIIIAIVLSIIITIAAIVGVFAIPWNEIINDIDFTYY